MINKFKNLNLRTKLLGSFILLSVIAGAASYVIPQLALSVIAEEAFPATVLTGVIRSSIQSQREEILEFVASGDREAQAEFFEAVNESQARFSQLEKEQPLLFEQEEHWGQLRQLSQEMATVGDRMFQSHTQVLGHLAIMQLIEAEIDDIFSTGQQLIAGRAESINQLATSGEGEADIAGLQLAFATFFEQINILQLEAINYVTFGDEADKARFINTARQLEQTLSRLEINLNMDNPKEKTLLIRLNRVKNRIVDSGHIVLAQHTKTLEALLILDEVEAKLHATSGVIQTTAQNRLEANTTFARRGLLAISTLALVLAVVIGGFLANSIMQPIDQLVSAAKQISAGRLGIRAQVTTGDEIGELAESFNQMVQKLQEVTKQVSSQAQERIQTLEVTTQITRRIATISEMNSLLKYVINAIHENFHFYHTQIYLIDDETEDLVLAHGYGNVGQKLQETQHQLKSGQGIVGTVAATNESFFSNDVEQALNFVQNPLLPDTRSELAVPLRKAERVIGVLDIQSDQLDRFTASDLALMQSLANQIAVSVDNLRLVEETQQALRENERLNARLTREGWEKTAEERSHRAYRFIGGDQKRITPAANVWTDRMHQAVQLKDLITHTGSNGDAVSGSEVAVPLILRGQVIGVMEMKKDAAKSFTTDELEIVKAVANQTSLALESARLSEEQESTIIQLRDVDRLKSEFLTSMSHELRTPLNSIIGFADILLQGIDGPLSENALTDVTAIHNSGKHLLALINDLLDLSKIEAGRMELNRENLSVSDVFNEVLSSVTALLTQKDVDLVIDIPNELPNIWADPLRLNQVLINLVSNGIKFTEEGQVVMRANVTDNQLMEISVSDTGIGIPQDKFDLVFEHFRQVDSRTNRKFQGTGMGLAIARQLAELHGGSMWIDSVMGEGTTFTFTIPVVTEELLALKATTED